MRLIFVVILIATLHACHSQDSPSKVIAEQAGLRLSVPGKNQPEANQSLLSASRENQKLAARLHSRDWQEILSSGVIRAARLERDRNNRFPRTDMASDDHKHLFESFAKRHQLQVEWVTTSTLEQMFLYLRTNRVDIVPNHLTITNKRKSSLAFSKPLMLDKEILVTASNRNGDLDRPAEVTLFKDSAYIDTARMQLPEWKIKLIEAPLTPLEIADALNLALPVAKDHEYPSRNKKLPAMYGPDDVASPAFDFTIIDKRTFDALAKVRNDIKPVRAFEKVNELAWAVNLTNQSLLQEVNAYILTHQLTTVVGNQSRYLDLDAIKRNHLNLRMITRNSPETYFMWRGELMGFEYELMKRFAAKHKIHLDVVVAHDHEEMIDLLSSGKGDLIAAGLSRKDIRQHALAASNRYHEVAEKIIANKQSAQINSWTDLRGLRLMVRQNSDFWQDAKRLSEVFGVELVAADKKLTEEQLIGMVERGEIDLTITDSSLYKIEKSFRKNIYSPLTLSEKVPYTYVVRPGSARLLTALNQFIEKEHRSTFYNVLKSKYFTDADEKKALRQERLEAGASLSPFDQLVKRKSREYDFDWRLITAQMYQESRFDPKAHSKAGARGLMQLLPRTAKQLGYRNLHDPEQSISAGVEYLDWTREQFNDSLAYEEKTLFALAAYNAGYGHVEDARLLARELNLRPDKWFGHVEQAMLLLQQPRYYRKARFGYVKGSEPVNYVRQIHQRYLNYISLTN